MPFPDSTYESQWHLARRAAPAGALETMAPPVRLSMPSVMHDVLVRMLTLAMDTLYEMNPWEIEDKGDYDLEVSRFNDMFHIATHFPKGEE